VTAQNKTGPLSEAQWQACTEPHRLVRYSRRRGNARKFLLLGCAIVRNWPGGVRSSLGRQLLAAIEEAARQPRPVRLIEDVLSPRFPEVFWIGGTWERNLTREGRRLLGEDSAWLINFIYSASTIRQTDKALPNRLIVTALGALGPAAVRVASAEIESIRQRLAESRQPPGFLRLLVSQFLPGLTGPTQEQVRDAILALLPAHWQPFLNQAGARQALIQYRRQQHTTEVKAVLSRAVREVMGYPVHPWRPRPEWLLANDGAARSLSEDIDRSGDFSVMPVLADALEDAGCCDAAALEHCRGTTTHHPGCWVIDAILGR
jgi:hypothetical protein